MRAPFLVHLRHVRGREGQASHRAGILTARWCMLMTRFNLDDDVHDDPDEDDDFDEDDEAGDDDEDDEDPEEEDGETWQV